MTKEPKKNEFCTKDLILSTKISLTNNEKRIFTKEPKKNEFVTQNFKICDLELRYDQRT